MQVRLQPFCRFFWLREVSKTHFRVLPKILLRYAAGTEFVSAESTMIVARNLVPFCRASSNSLMHQVAAAVVSH